MADTQIPEDVQALVDKSGEHTVSGGSPSPETDDSVVDNAHDMGLYTEDEGDNPQELDIAGEVQDAEEAHQEAPPGK